MSQRSPNLRAGTPLVIGALSVVLLVAGLGTWMAYAQLAGSIIAPGRVQVETDRQMVQHPTGGVVATLEIREGQRVAAGDLIARLDPLLLQSELTIVEGQLFEVMARRGRLEAERDAASDIRFDALLLETAASRPELSDLIRGQRALFTARLDTAQGERAQLRRRQDQITSQIDGIDAQRRSVEAQLALLQAKHISQQSLLDRGLSQASRVLTLEREMASLEGRIGELRAAAAEASGRATEIDLQLLQMDSQRREGAIATLRDLRVTEAELVQQRVTLLAQLDRLDIRAPVDGVVHDLGTFGPGAVVQAAEPLLFLIPSDRPLVIASRVRPTDVDQVAPGQEVQLRFSAFDMRRTPDLVGRVVGVSADAFTDPQTGASYYRAEILPADGELEKLGDLALLPGMPVESFIRTQDRTPLAYLIEPLAVYFSLALREG